jgi:hypothetical protein
LKGRCEVSERTKGPYCTRKSERHDWFILGNPQGSERIGLSYVQIGTIHGNATSGDIAERNAKFIATAMNACDAAGLTVEQLEGGALERWKTTLELIAAAESGAVSKRLRWEASHALNGGKASARTTEAGR